MNKCRCTNENIPVWRRASGEQGNEYFRGLLDDFLDWEMLDFWHSIRPFSMKESGSTLPTGSLGALGIAHSRNSCTLPGGVTQFKKDPISTMCLS
jgi:hypothetical protein